MSELALAITAAEAEVLIANSEGYEEATTSGCWEWSGQRSSTGKGPFLAFYEATFGEVPAGLRVYHSCGDGRNGCVRPTHLDIIPTDTKLQPQIAQAERDGFAQRIADERAARKSSRAEFAKELGYSASTIKDWENGVSLPAEDTHRQLARKLGWDGHLRRFEVIFMHRTIEKAHSAGEAARIAQERMRIEGVPLKTTVLRARVLA